jgi:hypothetical protein
MWLRCSIRYTYLALILTLAVAIAIVFSTPTAGAGAAEEKIFALVIVDGAVADGNRTIRVTEGDRVKLVWSADRDTEIDLHGYAIKGVVGPEETLDMAFTAAATGRFPITGHGPGGAHVTLGYLEVHPR